jgi:CheY-like chemotaxis protein
MDPSQLDQVLANLAVNARDAINGPGTLSIRTSAATVDREAAGRNPDASPGDYILLAVSDDGCGMDKETLSHLFEPFFTTKEAGKGTGLGLATVYGIVRQNNGFLTVESSPGLGSVFRVYLPRLAGTAATRSEAAEQAPLRGVETILLVEDEASILELARMLLEELGYKVLAAGGAKEALELAGKNPGPIHLLLTDVVMPRMNGPELASRLAALRPGLRCLYMSGYAEGPGARGPSLELDYLRKPFTLTDLSRKVREVLDRPAARPEARPEAAWRPEASGQGRGGIDESLPQR